MSLEKLFGDFYKVDVPLPADTSHESLVFEKKRGRFISHLKRLVSQRKIRRLFSKPQIPHISKRFALLVVIILGVFWLMDYSYRSIPRSFPLAITSEKSKGSNDIVSYSLHEKPGFGVKTKKVNPILVALVQLITGKKEDGFIVSLDTPSKKDIVFKADRSLTGGSGSSFLIKKAYADDPKVAESIGDMVISQKNGEVSVALPRLNDIQGAPRGRYAANVTWVKDGIRYNSVYTFSWGVLVMNTDKDLYEKGDQVRVGAGMVDDRGYTICEGDVTATIIDPEGVKATIRTARSKEQGAKSGGEKLTEEQMSTLAFITGGDSSFIATSPKCGPHSITDDPDYSFQFSTPKIGTYTIDLSATTEHGVESVQQKISVVEDNEIQIARTAAMRIYPLANYEMKLSVLSKTGYTGTVVESVPADFGITCSDCVVAKSGDRKKLTWTVSLKPGAVETLSYTYDPPDVSPALFNVGPVVLGERVEARVWAIAFDAVVPQVTLNQRTYIMEDDDGASVNSNTDIAAENTALTNVKKGTRISARAQVVNTSSNTFFNPQFELFYDRNDNIWTRVEASGSAAITPGTGNCTDTNWDCAVVDNSVADVGAYTAVAVDQNGSPWVAYQRGTGNGLSSARYVGRGGNCGGSGGAWNCTVVDSSAVASDIDIAISASGSAWISYKSGNYLKVASFLGSGGNCTDTAWGCTSIEFNAGGTYGQGSSIAFDQSGVAWVSYRLANLPGYAKYVGTGGTNCSAVTTEWTCSSANGSATVPVKTSIAFDQSGNPWISVYNSGAGGLRLHTYVGSGGNCTLRTAWNCTIIDAASANIGNYNSIKFDASGTAWISYQDTTNGTLKVAKYVGSGGNCTDTAWSCSVVDNTAANMGQYTSISFDPTGKAWISYEDATNGKLRVAQYVGSGGSGCKSGVTDWLCTNVDGASAAQYTSIEFDQTGNAWISYYDSANTRLKYARIKRSGEIIPAYGLSGTLGAGLNAVAAGACSGGTSFVTGVWTQGVNIASSAAVLGNLGASQCTEISYLVDTSRAIAGTTYRLRLHNKSPGYDIGLNTYTQNPTFTIVDTSTDTLRSSKDAQYALSNCTDTTWGCGKITSSSQNLIMQQNNLTFDASGSAWISSFDNWNADLVVSRYVGSGGSGCGTGVLAWTCQTVDHSATSSKGEMNSIGIDPRGKPWVAYYDRVNAALEVAEYVGSGGSGCKAGVTDWLCYDVDTWGTDTGGYTSIAFDKSGNPWISNFGDTQTLRLAKYVGSNGTGCVALTTWTCTTIDTNTGVGRYTTLKFDQNGTPWISYTDQSGANAIKIAQYIGSGGGSAAGCGTASSTEWRCETIDDQADTLGQSQVQMAIDNNNVPWVAYSDITASDLWVAKFVGSGGTGCTSSTYSGKWSCTKIEATNLVGTNLSIAISPDNKPWITYYDATNTGMRLAKYVGGGSGSGCGGGSTDWSCSSIDNTGTTGQWTSLAFDPSGVPWVAQTDAAAANTELHIAKLHLPYFDNQLRFKLDPIGYTAITSDDTLFDAMPAVLNLPVYRFSQKYSSNASAPPATWIGKSSVAASSANILLQVYRFGSTNAWETVTTNSSCSANADCTITGTPAGTASEYYESDGSSYWAHFRVYQAAGTVKTLQTDYFTGASSTTTYTQSSYRLYANVDSVDVVTPLNTANSSARLSSIGQAFRLRSLINVAGTTLAASGQAFKLQFAGKGSGSCAAPSGTPSSYTDVTLGGFNWNTETAAAAWSTRYQHKSVVFNNKLWVFGGFDGSSPDPADVYSSSDGVTWNLETSSPGWTGRDAFGAVVFDNKMWIMGGFDGVSTRLNDVWYSTDGVNWTQATSNAGWSVRNNFDVIVYHGKMWLLGGYTGSGNGLNDVYYSSDGANWTQATAAASWPARQLVRGTVFNDKMWAMSGIGASNYNDVWYSTDGANWTQATSNADWTARRGDAVITVGNTMYLMGGWNGTTAYNDVWYSSDGATWYQSTSSSRWSVRSYMTVGFLNSKIYLMGGLLNTNSTRYHDVYSTYLTQIGFQANTSTASPSAITALSIDPTDGTNTTVPQTYTEGNTFTNSTAAIGGGQDGEWDFALRDNYADPNTRYCMRIVQSNGTALGTYNYYPEIYTGPVIQVGIRGPARVKGGVRIGN